MVGFCKLIAIPKPNIMSYHKMHSSTSGSRTLRESFEFGTTYVVKPKGKHQVTIVWLHGLGDNGSSCSQMLESLPLPNIKWICPTAPTRPVALLGEFPCTAWFDVQQFSENGSDDFIGLDASAAHIANFLSSEPPDGIGGFSMGAATALYSATCEAIGRYSNGSPYHLNLRAVIGLSGWLPGMRTLKSKIEGSRDSVSRAASIPLFLCHGTGKTCSYFVVYSASNSWILGEDDDVVPFTYGVQSAQCLHATGFRQLLFKGHQGLGHYTVPKEMDELRNWLSERFQLEGFR